MIQHFVWRSAPRAELPTPALPHSDITLPSNTLAFSLRPRLQLAHLASFTVWFLVHHYATIKKSELGVSTSHRCCSACLPSECTLERCRRSHCYAESTPTWQSSGLWQASVSELRSRLQLARLSPTHDPLAVPADGVVLGFGVVGPLSVFKGNLFHESSLAPRMPNHTNARPPPREAIQCLHHGRY